MEPQAVRSMADKWANLLDVQIVTCDISRNADNQLCLYMTITCELGTRNYQAAGIDTLTLDEMDRLLHFTMRSWDG